MKFSANLGFLWTDRPLPEAIHAASAAGFDAVECHFPYDTPCADVSMALAQTGLTMIGINTRRGDIKAGENGLCALVGGEQQARAAIDEGVNYAHAIGAKNLHVMAGVTTGPCAHTQFVENLHYACARAAQHDLTILIEPLNSTDAPGYFLTTTAQALEIIHEVGAPNLKLMFDCYHVQIMEGNLTRRLTDLLPYIGHIQFASVPNRSTPDRGEVNFDHVFQTIQKLGYGAPLGAEYIPDGETGQSLAWLRRWSQSR
jgi:hydroxypyruvate isomerase